jgi:hypothetical protein
LDIVAEETGPNHYQSLPGNILLEAAFNSRFRLKIDCHLTKDFESSGKKIKNDCDF